MKYTNEDLYCAKYLLDRGLLTTTLTPDFIEQASKFTGTYTLTELPDDYWHKLAAALRPLWPAGSKDGKYEWRGSVESLASRLQTLWRIRKLKDYSIDTCVEVANQYLARYRQDAKYMQVLQYFILKQKTIKVTGGPSRVIHQSVFADMLENATDEVLKQKEWNDLLEGASSMEQGRLV